ncbi:MAG: DUF5320 domain-containing protein [Patescibacteria group bacterium]|nr:DUF5320 domain-containing protein [Patescibacteria group bacterium]
MPRLNGTGPMGQGARTGRGLGRCGNGMGIGYGCRNGYGFRRFISPKNELQALEDDEKMLLEELEIIKAEKRALKNEK